MSIPLYLATPPPTNNVCHACRGTMGLEVYRWCGHWICAECYSLNTEKRRSEPSPLTAGAPAL